MGDFVLFPSESPHLVDVSFSMLVSFLGLGMEVLHLLLSILDDISNDSLCICLWGLARDPVMCPSQSVS